MAQHDTTTAWDTSYEWKTVALLGVGFGLVGLDRWIIASLFPAMAADLGLPEGEIGRLAGILGILWGVFAIFSGRLSDAIGHRKVLIPAIILFSLMSGFSGMVQGLVALVWIRAHHGSDGGHVLPDELHRGRRGVEARASRLQSGFAAERLRAHGLCARSDHCNATAAVVPSWRYVFWICAIPGFIVGVLLYFHSARAEGHASRRADRCDAASGSWVEVLKVAEHRRLHDRAALRDGVRVRARRDGADLPHERVAACADRRRPRRLGARLRRLLRAVRLAGTVRPLRPQAARDPRASSARRLSV